MAPFSPRWFVVVDSQKSRLLRGSRTHHGSVHLEEIAHLDTTFSAGQHHRPDRMGQPGRAGGAGHEHEEKLSHFAREVTPWLQQLLTTHAVDSCALYAPAHMLGALRKALPASLAKLLVEHDVELASLPKAQLMAHPRIQELLGV
jgi:protein required for attachment to host cells